MNTPTLHAEFDPAVTIVTVPAGWRIRERKILRCKMESRYVDLRPAGTWNGSFHDASYSDLDQIEVWYPKSERHLARILRWVARRHLVPEVSKRYELRAMVRPGD